MFFGIGLNPRFEIRLWHSRSRQLRIFRQAKGFPVLEVFVCPTVFLLRVVVHSSGPQHLWLLLLSGVERRGASKVPVPGSCAVSRLGPAQLIENGLLSPNLVVTPI